MSDAPTRHSATCGELHENLHNFFVGASIVLLFAVISHAEIQTVAEHNGNETATPEFKFKNVPPPSRNDAATTAKFTIVDGRSDPNGGDVESLRDGRVPIDEDQPSENFFFGAGTEGGRLLVDLGAIAEVRKVNTYSWHSNTRGPQVYRLYAADGNADDFDPQPKQGTSPENCGWKLVADVDTRPKEGEVGGQYGVTSPIPAVCSANIAISCSTSPAPNPPIRSATRSIAKSTWMTARPGKW